MTYPTEIWKNASPELQGWDLEGRELVLLSGKGQDTLSAPNSCRNHQDFCLRLWVSSSQEYSPVKKCWVAPFFPS